MSSIEARPNICLLSSTLRINNEEQYFSLQNELNDDYICIPGPSLEPVYPKAIVNEDEFKAAHKLNHNYRRKLWFPVLAVDFLLSKALDETGASAIEAEVASEVNEQRLGRDHIKGILVDDKKDFELGKVYQYPFGNSYQIQVEFVHSTKEIASVLAKMASENS